MLTVVKQNNENLDNNKGLWKSYASALIGTSLEYYDYSLFVFLGPLISGIFFPNKDPASALILTYGIGFLGTLFRPLGAFVFGYIGDRWGRKVALSNSIIVMSLASVMMALMPTYSQIGLWAPFLVMLCRVSQSMSAGGELNGSAIFVIEHVGETRAGLAGGMVCAFTALGVILASFASYICTLPGMPSYSWRIAFGLGLLAGLSGYVIRVYSQETKQFLDSVQNTVAKNKVKLKLDSQTMFKCFCASLITGAFTSMYYFSIVFMNAYIPLVRGIERSQVSKNITQLLLVYMLALIFSGLLTDKFTQKSVMKFAGSLFLCLSIPCVYAICFAPLSFAFTAQLLLVASAGLFNGAFHSMLNLIFPVDRRYRFISVFYSIGSALLGSATPVVCLKLWHLTHLPILPVVWVLFTVSMGIFAVVFVPILKTERCSGTDDGVSLRHQGAF